MSDEKEKKEQGKQAGIKAKLKDMGVMRDENAAAPEHKTAFWRSKLVLTLLLAIGVWAVLLWHHGGSDEQRANDASTQTASNGMNTPPYGYPMGPGAQRGMPPQGYPMGPGSQAGMPPRGYPMGPGAQQGMPPQMSDRQAQSSEQAPTEQEARDHWGRPMMHPHEAYGPPPGWGRPMPYGPYGYYPPPPPAYYGYGQYYGPPPGYGNPYNQYQSRPQPEQPQNNE
jgi:hypothetical protein